MVYNMIGSQQELINMIPSVYPYTGKLKDENFVSLINLLCQNFKKKKKSNTLQANLKYLKKNMLKEKPDPIQQSNKTFIDYKKRDCLRYMFKTDMVGKIKQIIFNEIKTVSDKQFIKPEDIKFEMSFGDILLYQKGGKFGIHQDNLLYNPGYEMYSLLIGLDSDLWFEASKNEGNTTVYLPSWYSTTVDPRILEHKNFSPHIFDQSCQPGEFLIFPSQVHHESIEITNGHKMILKLNLWIKIPKINKSSIEKNNMMYNSICQCKLCYPKRHLVNEMRKNLDSIPSDILNIITSYYRTIRKECICHWKNWSCNCTCSNCCQNIYCTDQNLRVKELTQELLNDLKEERYSDERYY